MRKNRPYLLAILLAVCVMAFAGLTAAEGAAADEKAGESPVSLPDVGEVIHGFEVKEIRDFPMAGAQLVLLEHQKTGGRVVYIANEDTNRVFQLSFKTRPMDDTGLPHVFEHATLYGSEKYPSKTLLFNAMYQTYNTYINAYTTDAMTGYPVASLSEEQLLRLADWYTDSCFHPNIMTDESIYKTQAWHYEMADADSPLTLEGTVYSEMTGAMTLDMTAMYNANRLTFPGAGISFQYGGIPEKIPEMTWEQLKNYHDLYYHPSNCVAWLYGELTHYEDFLSLLDQAFSGFERREFTGDDPGYKRIEAPVVEKIAYPAAAGTDTTNRSTITYYVLCPGMKEDPEAEQVMDHLCSLLSGNGSLLMQNLKKALPTISFSVAREVAAPDDAVMFYAANVNENDGEIFLRTIQDSLKTIAEEGFDQALLDALTTSIQLSNKMSLEGGNPVDTVVHSLAYYEAVTGNPFAYAENMEAYGHMDEENAEGRYTEAIRTWLLDPALYTLITTYTAPGLKEQADEALAAKLAEIKAGMTPEEIEAIVAETNAQPEEEDNSALMAKLRAVDVASLPEEVKTYESRDETDEDGVRRIDVVAGVDGVGEVNLLFDASALPQEDIHYMRLYTRLLGQMDTEDHPKEELAVLMDRYLYSRTIGVQVSSGETDEDVRPWLVAQWISLDEDLSAGYDLIRELLLRTKFTDTQVLSERISAQKASVRSQISSAPYQANLMRGLGLGLMMNRYYDYLNYTDYYAFLEALEQKMAAQPEEVIAGLERVQHFLLNRSGAIAAFAGNEESIAVNRPLADAFMAELPAEKREKAALNLPAAAGSEGLIVDTNTGFNTLVASFHTLEAEPDEGLRVIASLVADQLLVPLLRDQMGVYTPMCDVYDQDKGLFILTYRDPNVAETFDVYRRLPEMIRQMNVDQETLNGYILSTYSALAMSMGELTGAEAEISRLVEGRDADRTIQQMRQLKQVTPDSLEKAAEIFTALWEKGYRATAAGAGTVNANAEMYDAVLNPFGAVDAGEVTLSDVTEDRPDYAAIRFAYENGLMALKGEASFEPDGEATAGDLYAALYVLIGGGSGVPEEAMATFAQAGLVPEGTEADTPLTIALRDQVMSGFAAVTGLELPALGTGENGEAIMTRGELAQDLTMFDDGQ